jgi:hypothetical protein
MLEPTPLSEICLLRIQGYYWPCSKLRDTCYTGGAVQRYPLDCRQAVGVYSTPSLSIKLHVLIVLIALLTDFAH